MASAGERWTVGMLPSPLGVGTVIDRRAWPMHVTIAGNFVTSATERDVVAAVERAAPSRVVVVEWGRPATFAGGLRVLLVQTAAVSAIHERLAGELEALPGFEADEPQFWRGGFVPHVTLGAGVVASPGDVIRLASIAVSRLTSGEAEIVAEFSLPSA